MNRITVTLATCGLIALTASTAHSTSVTCAQVNVGCDMYYDGPAVFPVVENTGGVADPAGEFTITLYDCFGHTVSGADVTLQSVGYFELVLCSSQPNGETVSCENGAGTRSVTGTTNSSGVATFRIVGYDQHYPDRGVFASSVGVFACNHLCHANNPDAQGTWALYDLDGGGLSGTDLAVWLDDYAEGGNRTRSDYDGDGLVTGADLAAWLDVWGAMGSAQGCSEFGGDATCP